MNCNKVKCSGFANWEETYKAYQIYQSFWFELEEAVKVLSQNFSDEMKYKKFYKILNRYGVKDAVLSYPTLDEQPIVGIDKIAEGLVLLSNNGVNYQHHIISFPMALKNKDFLTLYTNDIDYTTIQNNNVIILTRKAAKFDKNLRIHEMIISTRAVIPNPTTFPVHLLTIPCDEHY